MLTGGIDGPFRTHTTAVSRVLGSGPSVVGVTRGIGHRSDTRVLLVIDLAV